MGSMGSRPKVQTAAPVQYIYVPAEPAYTAPAAQTPAATTPAAQTPIVPAEQNADTEQPKGGDTDSSRNSGLLERKRGTASTILTGFRGVLSQTTQSNQRKTLLGE